MSATLDLSGLDKRLQQLHKLNDNPNMSLNAAPLMYTWAAIIETDNRQGVLNGTDKDGIAMKPVTYRPKSAPGLRVGMKFATLRKPKNETKQATKARELPRTKAARKYEPTSNECGLVKKRTSKRGRFMGLGVMSSGVNNNLTSAQYRLLGGPPLAPRDQFSRVITNLKVTIGGPPNGSPNWYAEGAWDEVVNVQGQPFLKYHFDGTGRLPRRDLRGVRPQGVAKAVDALRNWAKDAVRTLFS